MNSKLNKGLDDFLAKYGEVEEEISSSSEKVNSLGKLGNKQPMQQDIGSAVLVDIKRDYVDFEKLKTDSKTKPFGKKSSSSSLDRERHYRALLESSDDESEKDFKNYPGVAPIEDIPFYFDTSNTDDKQNQRRKVRKKKEYECNRGGVSSFDIEIGKGGGVTFDQKSSSGGYSSDDNRGQETLLKPKRGQVAKTADDIDGFSDDKHVRAVGYDKNGRRVSYSPGAYNVNISNDENGSEKDKDKYDVDLTKLPKLFGKRPALKEEQKFKGMQFEKKTRAPMPKTIFPKPIQRQSVGIFHKSEKKKYTCDMCGHSFGVFSLFTAHKLEHEQRRHDDENKRYNLRHNHYKPLPNLPAMKITHQCPYCDKKFALLRALHLHQMQNCTKIPAHEKRNLEYTEMEHIAKPPVPVFSAVRAAPLSRKIIDNKESEASFSDKKFSQYDGTEKKDFLDLSKLTLSNRFADKKKESSKPKEVKPKARIPCLLCAETFKDINDYTDHTLARHCGESGKYPKKDGTNPEIEKINRELQAMKKKAFGTGVSTKKTPIKSNSKAAPNPTPKSKETKEAVVHKQQSKKKSIPK